MMFESSSVPGGAIAPAPSSAPTLGDVARGVRAFLRGMSDMDAYEGYRAHHLAHHPDQPLMDEATFWRDKWEDADKHPSARCC